MLDRIKEKSKRNIWINKRGVSLMVSYVLLIVIALSLSIGIYAWLKATSNVESTPSCPKGVFIIISDYSCDTVNSKIELSLKNKGTHSINGYIIRVSNDVESLPIGILRTDDSSTSPYGEDIYFEDSGHYNLEYESPLNPGDEKTMKFLYPSKWGVLEKIQIEPYRLIDNDRVLCEQAAITQELVNC